MKTCNDTDFISMKWEILSTWDWNGMERLNRAQLLISKLDCGHCELKWTYASHVSYAHIWMNWESKPSSFLFMSHKRLVLLSSLCPMYVVHSTNPNCSCCWQNIFIMVNVDVIVWAMAFAVCDSITFTDLIQYTYECEQWAF